MDDAPWLIATASGTISCNNPGGDPVLNQCDIITENGVRYTYMHLYFGIEDGNGGIVINNGRIESGQRIGQIAPWGTEAFHHLHYEISFEENYINPLPYIRGHTDHTRPSIAEVKIARRTNTGWQELADPDIAAIQGASNSAPACTTVSGIVDILAKVHDRDSDGADSACARTVTVGIYSLSWRLCPSSNPECNDWKRAIRYETMPISWHSEGNSDTEAQFSSVDPFVSQSVYETGYCSEKWLYFVATHSSRLDTSRYSDGAYRLTVVAGDVKGEAQEFIKQLCIQNNS
jgi:hypothetical protein